MSQLAFQAILIYFTHGTLLMLHEIKSWIPKAIFIISCQNAAMV